MKIALLTPGYPSLAQPYNWTFVHARAKAYLAYGHEVAAFCHGPDGSWAFEGVNARQAASDDLARALTDWRPDVVALHSPYFRLISIVKRVPAPRVVWVHGHEVLWKLGGFRHGQGRWTRGWRALKTPARLVWQWIRVRSFLAGDERVVFVSDWMRRAAGANILTQFQRAVVIPNPIDTQLFTPRWNPANLRHGVTIRSLNSRKYGVDLAIRAAARSRAADLTVVGAGSLEPPLRSLASRLGAPVRFVTSWTPHEALPEVHSHYGFFVAASRVEAQGVAMCESMASGLPVVATRVGGIPEFVIDGEGGSLVDPGDWAALGDAITRLVEAPGDARRQSEAARAAVLRTCAADVVVPRELAILREAASR